MCPWPHSTGCPGLLLPLPQLCQLLGAELRLASGTAGMSQCLGAASRHLLRPAADAQLCDAEAAGDIGMAEVFVEQAQGSPTAAFDSSMNNRA